jgi:hypothetical protein
MAGTLAPGPAFASVPSLYADTVCATVPHYGPELVVTGICNPSGVLASSGTFESAPYRGSAARRPHNLRVANVVTTAGGVTARLAGAGLPSAAHHVAAILLTDAASGRPVAVAPRSATVEQRDRRGRITAVHLSWPAGSVAAGQRLRAYVIVDGFPLTSRIIRAGGA